MSGGREKEEEMNIGKERKTANRIEIRKGRMIGNGWILGREDD
jgi:hypothetical protein